MSENELMKTIARESLSKFGDLRLLTAVMGASAPAQVTPTVEAPKLKRGKQAAQEAPPKKVPTYSQDWEKVKTTCSRCDKIGFVIPDFGIRWDRGVDYKQSRCKECRGSVNYHAEPRKYNTKHQGKRRS